MKQLYGIKSLTTKLVYLGESDNATKSFERHKQLFRLGQHHNQVLQALYTLYGEDDILFFTIPN